MHVNITAKEFENMINKKAKNGERILAFVKEENNKNTHITCRHNKSPQNYHIHTGFTL